MKKNTYKNRHHKARTPFLMLWIPRWTVIGVVFYFLGIIIGAITTL